MLLVFVSSFVLPSVRTSPVMAEEASSETSGPNLERAASDILFAKGKMAQKQGDLSRACDDFDRSFELVPRAGTALNLGLCREEQRRLVEARAALQRTLTLLKPTENRRDRLAIARAHLERVEADLSWLEPTFSPGTLTDQIALTIDGRTVSLSQGAIPVDPGRHLVSVLVPGSPPRTFEISVGPRPEHRTVYIAVPEQPGVALDVTPLPASPAFEMSHRPPQSSSASGSTETRGNRWWWGLGLAGLVATGSLIAFLVARSNPTYPPSDIHATYP